MKWIIPFLLSVLISPAAVAEFTDGKAAFSLRIDGRVCPYPVFSRFVLPGDRVKLEVLRPGPDTAYFLLQPDGSRKESATGSWYWEAPEEPGLYTLGIAGRGETITLNVFVQVPMSRIEGGKLQGYTIGDYPAKPLKGLAIYKPPRGLIEVTQENEDTLVSPHFRLKQFLCKQSGGYPKYLVLQERLLLKLELLLQQVNAAGYPCDTFHVMSGYRTPHYNAAIGNVQYSRHVWGGAADIFIDQNPADGMMDDLNRDGKIDYRDAAVLYELVDGLYGDEDYEPYVGGLGRYKKTPAHGPFVHVDVRGFRARWGT